ncbi:hypothetical protein DOJK_01463 [Patescibacteria group bacterium]|nr:hypothetical protein DOJK_01463 [Patescibacteria group bacterium]
MKKNITIELETGHLQLELDAGTVPLNRLLGFAARVSSKRKFLFVSKVLGKHYPVSPLMMSWTYRALARQALAHTIGSSVWIGMAETATGLGYGVFEAAHREGLNHALFMQTTRYHLNAIERLEFEEAHSHATDFFLYYPTDETYKQHFLMAETLVLIDDEISTGRTFLRLIKAYQRVNPNLKRVFIVSLVNFAYSSDRLHLETEAGIDVKWLALRQGLFSFTDKHNTAIDNITVNASSNAACKKHLLAWQGRLGMMQPVQLSANPLPHFKTEKDLRPVLVLGTGECNAPAYLLGRELEAQGFRVKVQSTSRSPIHQGNDIQAICQFEDNYEDGISNYLYNMNPSDYREIILCHETPLNPPLLKLLHDWQAISARFEQHSETYATLHFFRP